MLKQWHTADDETTMTWEDKVDHWAIRLIAPAFVIWAAASLSNQPEAAWQSAGGTLELLGFLVAAYCLQDKLAHVTDRPSLRERLARWFRRIWRRIKKLFGWEPEPITPSLEMGELTLASLSIPPWLKTNPDASLDQRVQVLEQQVNLIRSRVKDVRKEGREGRAGLKEEIGEIRSDHREVKEKSEDRVRQLAIGSFHWEVTGLFWFVLGVVATTWPEALSRI